MEPWKDGSLLVRFEHILERSEDPQKYSQSVTFNLGDVLRGLSIAEIRETTLSANQWINEAKRFTFDESNDTNTGFDYTVPADELTKAPKPFERSDNIEMVINLDPKGSVDQQPKRSRRHAQPEPFDYLKYKNQRKKTQNYADRAVDPMVITLSPMQIRTYVLTLA